MSQSSDSPQPAMPAAYVLWVVLFVFAFSIAKVATMVGLYALIYGVPSVNDVLTFPVPEYSQSTYWKGKVWFELLKMSPGSSFSKATLRSVDPQKDEGADSKIMLPFPVSGFCPQDDQLWAVTPSQVFHIQGEQAEEFKPKRLLNRPCEPFLYQNQLAVIDTEKNGASSLLVFEDHEWVDLGTVVLPTGFTTKQVDGQPVLAPIPQSTKLATLMDLKVVARGDRFHLFMSDGTVIAHSDKLELAPASALNPTNTSSQVDISNLADWELVTTNVTRIGAMTKTALKVGLLDGEPIVFTTSSFGGNPFSNVSIFVFQRINNRWQSTTQVSSPALIDLLVVTDGKQTYVAGQTFVQTLRFHRLTAKGLESTGVVLKAPSGGFQALLERIIPVAHWVYWPALLLYALGVTRLVRAYRAADYQFGKTTVELASYTRRGIARVIDYFVYVGPVFLVNWSFGLATREQMEQNMDRILDAGPSGMLMRYLWMVLTSLICSVVLLMINSVIQGTWGLSLGKWICGIRTVRTTLRPCGVLRAMLRELLMLADTVLGMTLIPVTFLYAFTSLRQRIGDLVADTIVIRRPIPSRSETADFAGGTI